MPQSERLLVLLRHGQSEWNLKNLFTGWRDIDLSPLGVEEAKIAGRRLKARGLQFDVAFTSALTRAQHTLALTLAELGHLEWLPIPAPCSRSCCITRARSAPKIERYLSYCPVKLGSLSRRTPIACLAIFCDSRGSAGFKVAPRALLFGGAKKPPQLRSTETRELH